MELGLNQNFSSFPQFTDEEINNLIKILDVEDSGIINLQDIEESQKMLGLEGFYSNIKSLIQHLVNFNIGGISIRKFKKFLLDQNKTSQEGEISDIFDSYDYDKKGQLTKHKLKIQAQELGIGKQDDKEAEEMISMFSNEEDEMDWEAFEKFAMQE